MFDSRHIRTFHEVVASGSYSAAARVLGYTQPAITQQMKALERAVGTPLFTRVGRKMQLTEAGESLARHAESILGSLSAAEAQLKAYARLRTGRVRLCGFPSANVTLVPEALSGLAMNHPGVQVELLEGSPRSRCGGWSAGSATSPWPSPTRGCTRRSRTRSPRSGSWRTS